MIKYVMPGTFVPGLPSRDMTVEEWEACPVELREWAVSLGLYEVQDGREDAGVVDVDPESAAAGGESHRSVSRSRRGEAEGGAGSGERGV